MKNTLVSVTILTYNRPEFLKRTLDSFLSSSIYDNLEFLIWANSANTPTENLINSYDIFSYKHFSNDNKGIGIPRNILNEKSKGKYILHLEEDWELRNDNNDDFISRACDVLENNSDIGQILFRKGIFGKGLEAYPDHLGLKCYGDFTTLSHTFTGHPIYSNNPGIVPKRIFDDLGPFPKHNQEYNWGSKFDKKYKVAKLGKDTNNGYFWHIGVEGSATSADALEFQTPFVNEKPSNNMKNTVCLNMMVKNEANNLRRFHSKLKNYIDEYLIVDTGSTDNTKEVIKEIFKGIPGSIVDRPFDDFSSCRNESLDKIKSDYILMLDADHELKGDLSFIKNCKSSTTKHYLFNWVEAGGGVTLKTPRLIQNTGKFKWKGRCHEYLDILDGSPMCPTDKIHLIHYNSGGMKSSKYEREIPLLKQDFKDAPNHRSAFYVAMDSFWSGDLKSAIKWYTEYLLLEGMPWIEELNITYIQLGRCFSQLGNLDVGLKYFEIARSIDNEMLEGYVYAAEFLNNNGRYKEAYDILINAPSRELPVRTLWVENHIYTDAYDLQMSIAAYYIGDMDTGKNHAETLVNKYPDNPLYKQNYNFYT